jgi:serine/threonine-protein kinase
VAAAQIDDVDGWDAVEHLLEERRRATPNDAPEDAARFAPGDVVAARYRVDRVIGRGGMGEVYEAHDLARDQPVALKWLRAALPAEQGDLYRRFLREGRVGLALSSPHVVRVLEVSSDPALPFLVMELVRGSDLALVVASRQPLAAGPVARAFVQACAGLAAVHAAGLVHRDVKPSNLLLHEADDGALVVKLGDFGIAKRVHTAHIGADGTGELTDTGSVVGSPHYMSPEQIRAPLTVDARSDVFGMGITLYRTLAGRGPWGDDLTPPEVLLRICTETPTPLGDVAPWLDPGLVRVVHRALARAPEERFASARAFAEALAPFASDAPLMRAALAPDANAQRMADPDRSADARTPGPSPARRPRAVMVTALAAFAVGVALAIGAVSAPTSGTTAGHATIGEKAPAAKTASSALDRAPEPAPIAIVPEPARAVIARPHRAQTTASPPASTATAAPPPLPSIPPIRQVW